MTRMSTRSSSRISEVTATKSKVRINRRISILSSSDDDSDYDIPNNTKQNVIVHSNSSSESLDRTPHKNKLPVKTTMQNDSVISPRKEKSRTKLHELNQLSPVTPTKQKRMTNIRSDENVPSTPSSLMRKLALKTPEKVERTSLIPTNQNLFPSARKALHSTFPTSMPGRENELKEVKSFIEHHFENGTSGSLYISGPPGTGKTASLNMIFDDEKIKFNLRKVYINCTAIKSANAIYSRIVKELGICTDGKTDLGVLEEFLKKRHKMILLVLDEIDQLESKNQSILYTIFEWPSRLNSNLILIGIANALDLTDRILPRLQMKCELKPKLVHFAPYTKQQIIDIFKSRLKSANIINVFNPAALEILAAKVAAISGDVRRALDIGRRVIELVDQNPLKPIENLDVVSTTVVGLKEVVSVLNNVYGTTQNLTDDADDGFPLQQKIIVCTLLLMLTKAKNKDITIGRLHEVYRKVCKKRNILAVDQAEFVGLCSLIETRGIIRVVRRKEARLHKVSLEWDTAEVEAALKDKQLMSMILQDDSCLGKM